MRVALIHDYLTQLGGAERVLEAFAELFPRAPIYTLMYDEGATKGRFAGRIIRTSFLQKLPLVRKHHRLFPPFMPTAVEQFDLSAYDLVISDSASFAKGVITRPESLHICYCHTPTRFAWDDSHRYVELFGGYPLPMRRLAPLFLNWLRMWDYAASRRPDAFIANSDHVRRRIRKYYDRDAAVIYPPVRAQYFSAGVRAPKDHFLMTGRLMAYKRFDIGIQSAKKYGFRLRIAGDGPELKRLKRLAGNDANITFLGGISDEALRSEYLSCRALIFPQEEDFGIVPVEAMAAGSPVIAWRGGGALETVKEGETGLFFDQQNAESLGEAIRLFADGDFSPEHIRAYARAFDTDVFKARMENFISHYLTLNR